MTQEEVQVIDSLLEVLRKRGVTDFQMDKLVVRLGPEPLVYKVPVPVPANAPPAPDGTSAAQAAESLQQPLTVGQREALLATMDENSPLFDAVRRSA